MKKATRNLLIVALSLVLIGGILGFTGYYLGGMKAVGLTSSGPLVSNSLLASVNERWDKLTALDIDSNALNLKIVEGDSFSLTGKYDADNVTLAVSESNGVLKIHSSSRGNQRSWIGFSWPEQELTLTYPRNAVFDTASVNSDLGNLHAEGLNADTLKVKLAAGKFTGAHITTKQLDLNMDLGKCEIDGLEVSDNARTSLNSGSLTLKDSSVSNLTASNKLGSFDFTGTLSGKAKIDMDLGSLDLDLDNREADMSYAVSSHMGSVTLNGHGADSTASGGPSSASLRLEATTNMGSIDIRTK
jgi:hypothetical protein